MRRIIFTFMLVLVSALASGVVAPLTPGAHAQTLSSSITVTPSTVVTGSTATVQGAGFTPNNFAFVYWQRPDGTTNGTWVNTNSTGGFAFTLGFLSSHGTGFEYVAGYDNATATWSPFFQVTVTSTGPPPPSTRQLAAIPNPVAVSSATTVSGSGFSPNNYVYVQWQRPDSTTNAVYVLTDSTGHFAFQLQFLRSHGCGAETVKAYDFGTATWSNPYTITVNGC